MQFLYFLEGIRNPILTVIMEIFRYFGEEMVLLGLLSVLLLCIDKKTAYNIGFTFFLSSSLVNMIKINARVERPWVRDPNLKPLESALDTATGYSFPSAHSQTAASVYGTFACHFKKNWAKVICCIIFLLVGLSRMYAGVHTPADVCCGFLIALIVLFLEQKFIRPLIDREDPAPAACAVVAFLAVLCVIFVAVLVSKGVLPTDKASDTVKTAAAAISFAIAYYADMRWIHFSTAGTTLQRVMRVILDIGIALLIRAVLKLLFSSLGLTGDFLRYLIMTLWALCLYPYLSMKYRLQKGLL